jgi:hypothetical protein
MRPKVDIKFKLNQIIRDEIEKKIKTKYIENKRLRTKFNTINKKNKKILNFHNF